MPATRNRLIHARERLGLNRATFAHRVGVSRGYVTYIEDGRRDPSFSLMQRWLKALGPGAKADLFDPGAAPGAWPNTAELLCLDGKA